VLILGPVSLVANSNSLNCTTGFEKKRTLSFAGEKTVWHLVGYF
jgi:hypothetical protein